MSGYSLGQTAGSGRSFQQLVRGVTPAAGASFTLTNSGYFRSRLVACVFTLTTTAVVANRYCTVEVLQDDNTPFLIGAAAVNVLASTTNQRFAGSMFRGTSEWNAGTDVLFPLMPLYLEEGNVLKINVAAIDVGDQLAVIRFLFDRFPTSDDWFEPADLC